MSEIPGPYEYLEIEDGQSVTMHVVGFEAGPMRIHPTWAGAPEEKTVEGVRVFVTMADKEYLPYYWDVSQAHLVAALKPLLPGLVESKKPVKITARLTRPHDPASKRFSIEILG